jgi:hypothetical protein
MHIRERYAFMSYSVRGSPLNVIIAVIITLCFTQLKISAATCPPCDIYAAAGTPCVAAYSTVRLLLSTYKGPLYQVRRMSDNVTRDIYPLPLFPGTFANAAAQDSFLGIGQGTISKLYDQSGNGNDLIKAPGGSQVTTPDNESNAKGKSLSTTSGGKAYALYMNPGDGYRNNATKGMPSFVNQAQGIYWVVDGKHYNSGCCWDFGNAETNNCSGPTGGMECLYFGNCTYWGTGTGSGPWMMADFGNGIWAGGGLFPQKDYANNPTINSYYYYDHYVTGMLKGSSIPSITYSLKFGDATSYHGNLTTIYNGTAPSTWKLEGGIVLGIAGDNSNSGMGTFFEGAIINGYPPDTTEDAVQRNINTIYPPPISGTKWPGAKNVLAAPLFMTRYNPSTAKAVISYDLQDARRVSVCIFNQQGRLIATIVNGALSAGSHEAVWDAKRAPGGVYVCRLAIDGREEGSEKIIVQK